MLQDHLQTHKKYTFTTCYTATLVIGQFIISAGYF